ncbi:MAG: hypothetical protein ABWZ98_10660, partial [Nakamurella sp.]
MTTESSPQALGNQGRSTEQPPPGNHPAEMQRPVTRVILVVMALFGFIPGAWAAIAPESFYWDFPKIRSAWVSSDGP